MTMTATYQEEPQANPVDLVEQVVSANDWAFDRRNDEELAAEAPGQWCNYSLYFAWREDMGAMHFTCAFDMKVPAARRGAIPELLAMCQQHAVKGAF